MLPHQETLEDLLKKTVNPNLGPALQMTETAVFCLGINIIGKNNNTCTVQACKFASVWFDQGFQIWVGWN